MAVTGFLVESQIETGVTRNSAAVTALYVDSIIAPLLPDMQTSQTLDDSVAQALDETLGQGALGRRLMSFRLWRRDGTILYANDPELRGKRFEPNRNLKAAFDGQLVAEFNRVDDPESDKERASGEPLLEIYNPVRQPWSGEVVAVTEFYEVAPEQQGAHRPAAQSPGKDHQASHEPHPGHAESEQPDRGRNGAARLRRQGASGPVARCGTSP